MSERESSSGNKQESHVPSVVDPFELSGRPDSTEQMHRKYTSRETPTSTVRDSTSQQALGRATVDPTLVSETARWITAKVAATLKAGAQEVGEYVLDRFFCNSSELARAKNPNKNASFRALAKKCGTPELPISKTWLNNAVRVAILVRELPRTATAFRGLPPSYQETLLPLRDPVRVESMAQEVATKTWSYRELRNAVAQERRRNSSAPSGRGRYRQPAVIRALVHTRRLFGSDPGKSLLGNSSIQGLSSDQRQIAISSAEVIVQTLQRLIRTLRSESFSSRVERASGASSTVET